MTRLRTFLSRLRALVHFRRMDRDLDDEIASHLNEATDEYLRQGLSPEDACDAAQRGFGGVTQTKDVYRVLAGIVRHGLVLTGIGVVIGLAGAFGLSRLIASLLFGVRPADTATMIGVVALVLLVAALACLRGARRDWIRTWC